MRNIVKFLTINQYSRPGRKLQEAKGIILHWVGIPMQRAAGVWDFFETTCPQKKHFSSAHYIVDLNGDVCHAVPDSEVAYHCGSSQIDPASGRIYTDWAREKFGRFAENPAGNSPNNCTIGIEMCVLDSRGSYSQETMDAAAELTAHLVKQNNLTVDDIGHHNKVAGWKDCPRLWVNSPILFDQFKEKVRGLLGEA